MPVAVYATAAQVDKLQRCVAGASIQRLNESLQATKKGSPVLVEINLGTLRRSEGNQNPIKISGEVDVGAGIVRVKDQGIFCRRQAKLSLKKPLTLCIREHSASSELWDFLIA